MGGMVVLYERHAFVCAQTNRYVRPKGGPDDEKRISAQARVKAERSQNYFRLCTCVSSSKESSSSSCCLLLLLSVLYSFSGKSRSGCPFHFLMIFPI